MNMGLISTELNNFVNAIVGRCFAMNRLLDRDYSLLKVKWSLDNTAEFVHYNMAHAFIGEDFADKIIDYQISKNCLTTLPSTPIGDRDYLTPLNLFVDIYEECLIFNEELDKAIVKAKEEHDYSTERLFKELVYSLDKIIKTSSDMIVFFNDCDTVNKMLLIDADINRLIK